MRLTPLFATIVLCRICVLSAVEAKPAKGASALRSRSVVVAPDGTVVVQGKRVAKVELPPKPRRVRVRRRRLAGRCLLHVRVTGGTEGRAAELLVGCAGAEPLVFAGTTGPQGPDGEWTRTLALQRERVLLFEARPEIHLCNPGQPARLHAKQYDFDSNRFQAVPAITFSETLPRILATRRPPLSRSQRALLSRPTFNRFRVVVFSSAHGHAPHAAHLPTSTALQDGDPQSVWHPQATTVDAQPFLLARRPRSSYPLRGIVLTLAPRRLGTTTGGPSRDARLVLVSSDGRRYRVLLPKGLSQPRRGRLPVVWIWLPQPAPVDCLSLVIEGPHIGIAEIRFVTDLDLFPKPFDALFTDLAGGDPQRSRAAVGLLALQRGATLSQIERRIGRVAANVLPGYLRVLRAIRGSQSARLFGEAILRLPERSRTSALQDLAGMGGVAVDALAQLLVASPRDFRPQVIARLGALGGSAATKVLLATLTNAEDSTRRPALHALHRLAPRHLCPVLADRQGSTPLSANRRADLLSLLQRCCRARPATAQATTVRLIGTTWPSAAAFSLRYAMVRAAVCLGPERQRWLIQRALKAPEPPLRAMALHQLARSKLPARQVQPLLLRALTDADPAVRRAAADAAQHPRAAASPALSLALARALESEKWPFVAQSLASAIAVHCSPAATQSLGRAVHRGVPGPDRAALAALARCSASRYVGIALRIAADPLRRADLRTSALEAISSPLARRHQAQLLPLYAQLRQSIHNEGDLQVAAACAQVLARAGTPGAVQALVQTLESDPQEALQTAAATALGRVCTPSAASSLRRVAAHARSSLTARVAADSLGRCGFRGATQGASEPARKR